MRILFFISVLAISVSGAGQELFSFTEPASNMAAKSIGLRLNNFVTGEKQSSAVNYILVPEIMAGVSKNLMVHADIFLSNNSRSFAANGGSLYMKYRFLNTDDVLKHFRMAAYGRYSFNNSTIGQEDINLYGRNSGFELGVIATQLLHKAALSSSLSVVQAMDNGSIKYPYSNSSRAVNYTLSFGKLLLPKEYKDYRQTNLNLMLELLNQLNPSTGRYYIDAAPSVQLIFNSVARIDIGYRQQLGTTFNRASTNGLFVRFEYNFFNVY